MRKIKVVVAISDPVVRERVVATLPDHPDLDVATASSPQDLIERQGGGIAILWQSQIARSASHEHDVLMQLRRRWVLVVAYDEQHLLEASTLFDIADGWMPLELRTGTLEVLKLAREGLAVLPAQVDWRFGLDDVRRARLAALSPTAIRILAELPRGTTYGAIAEKLALPLEEVSTSLRLSMEHLCLQNRLEAAIFVARMLNENRLGQNPEESGSVSRH